MALAPWNSPANVGFLPRGKFDPSYTAAAFGASNERACPPSVYLDMSDKVGGMEDASLWWGGFPVGEQALHVLPGRRGGKAKEPSECCEHTLTLIEGLTITVIKYFILKRQLD